MSYTPYNWQTGEIITAGKLNSMEQGISAAVATAEQIESTVEAMVGSPLVAATKAAMTDTSKVYVYTGSETGMTAGNWYYYNGSAWTSGGVYNSVAVETDATLSIEGDPADAKAAGHAIEILDSAIFGYADPSTSVFIMSKGAISGNGNDNDNAQYQASRRRTNFGPYAEGTTLTCDSAYTMAVYYYASASWRNFINNGAGYIGNNFVLPYVENATNIRVMLKKVNDQNFGDTEMPVITVTARYNKVDAIDEKIPGFLQLRDLPAGTDLDTLYQSGWYLTGYSNIFPNSPDNSAGQRIVRVYSAAESPNAYRIQEFYNQTTNKYYVRVRSGGASGTYTGWVQINKKAGSENTSVIEFNNTEILAGSSDNSGIDLTVMSYNVANYNNDTSTYISDAQIVAFKKLLSSTRPDIIGLQENAEYLDSASTKASHTYLFTPVFPHMYGPNSSSIASKITGHDVDILTFSNGRATRVIYFTINNKTLLFVSAHPVANQNGTGIASAETIAARSTQYDELMKWVHQEITLNRYGTTTPISCQNWDWCIIAGDMNSITATDRTNLADYVEARGFTMANGGWLGWIKTEKTGYAIDNIICSPDVIINSVEVLEALAGDLYSDHYPVVSHVTLL